ncbi:hypothetical protein QFZ63_006446 [Streptomyces sp. B3I7]|nr:hypothetical protein [Streptomyces sp. B3I7]
MAAGHRTGWTEGGQVIREGLAQGWAIAYAERAATSAQKFPNCPTRQGRFCDHRPVPRGSDT